LALGADGGWLKCRAEPDVLPAGSTADLQVVEPHELCQPFEFFFLPFEKACHARAEVPLSNAVAFGQALGREVN